MPFSGYVVMQSQECSPAHMRGKLIMIEGALITGGIMMSYWIDFAFYWIEAQGAPHVQAAWYVHLRSALQFSCTPFSHPST